MLSCLNAEEVVYHRKSIGESPIKKTLFGSMLLTRTPNLLLNEDI